MGGYPITLLPPPRSLATSLGLGTTWVSEAAPFWQLLSSHRCHQLNVTNSRAKLQQTTSVEKHAHSPRMVYCSMYYTHTRFTKLCVSNLHITSTPDAARRLSRHTLQGCVQLNTIKRVKRNEIIHVCSSYQEL